MKKNWKYRISKITGCNNKLNRKVLRIKRSWDEVEGILNASSKKKKK